VSVPIGNKETRDVHLERGFDKLAHYSRSLGAQKLLRFGTAVHEALNIVPGEKMNAKEACGDMPLVNSEHGALRRGALFRRCKQEVLRKRLRERACLRDLGLQLCWLDGPIHVMVFALHRSEACAPAEIEEIYSVLTFASMAVTLERRKSPMCAEEYKAKFLELVLIAWLSIAVF
jgi:hypothetical protein